MSNEQLTRLENMHSETQPSAPAEIYQWFPEIAKALREAWAENEQMIRERNYLHKILNKLFGWKDESWLHAVAHIENAVINLQTSLRVERKLQKIDEARVEQLREAIARFVKQYPWQDGTEIQELKSLVKP
jgi:ribosomal 50S subunit-associated protein YjgA (DUF615 family)